MLALSSSAGGEQLLFLCFNWVDLLQHQWDRGELVVVVVG